MNNNDSNSVISILESLNDKYLESSLYAFDDKIAKNVLLPLFNKWNQLLLKEKAKYTTPIDGKFSRVKETTPEIFLNNVFKIHTLFFNSFHDWRVREPSVMREHFLSVFLESFFTLVLKHPAICIFRLTT